MNYIEPQDAISSFQREYNIQTVSSIFTCTLDSSSTIASLIELEELILVCPLCLCYSGVQSEEQRNSVTNNSLMRAITTFNGRSKERVPSQ